MTSLPTTQQPVDATRRAARSAGGWLWAAFLLAAVTCVALFLIPTFVIRPFRYQAPRALLLAMVLRQCAPAGTLIASGVSIVFAFLLWRVVRIWPRALLVLTIVLVAFSAVMAQLNYFEWMFHPIDSAQFLPQAQSKLDAKEMIMAVRFGDDARAYPISQMAYHHVLNDVVGGVPITVTY
jgi:amino acid transporter